MGVAGQACGSHMREMSRSLFRLFLAFPQVSFHQCEGILAGGALPDSELPAVLYCGVRVTAALWL